MQDFTVTIQVDNTPEEVFNAIINTRAWWDGEIEGTTDKLGGEFTYRYKEFHYSKHRITEFVPAKKVVWLIVEASLNFVDDKTEWNGTEVVFDIISKDNKTELRFTHMGLVPDFECYDACSNAWGSYITNSLKNLITKG